MRPVIACVLLRFYSVDSLSERASFAVTVVPEIRTELQRKQETAEDQPSNGKVNGMGSEDGEDATGPSQLLSSGDSSATSSSDKNNDDPAGAAQSNDVGGGGIVETRRIDPDDRVIRANDKKSLSQTSVNGFTRSNVQSKNE